MSTTFHSPSLSHSSTDFNAFRSHRIDPADSSFSPSQGPAATPARKRDYIASRHNSPVLMLTPSPLRKRTDLGIEDSPMQIDLDEFSNATLFSTPYKAPMRPFAMQRNVASKLGQQKGKSRAKMSNDDDDGLFLAPHAGPHSLPLGDTRTAFHRIRSCRQLCLSSTSSIECAKAQGEFFSLFGQVAAAC